MREKSKVEKQKDEAYRQEEEVHPIKRKIHLEKVPHSKKDL